MVFRRVGSGEVVVLIHGLAGSSRTWKDVMPTLARTYDVIAPDLLGHGDSAKPMGDPAGEQSGPRLEETLRSGT